MPAGFSRLQERFPERSEDPSSPFHCCLRMCGEALFPVGELETGEGNSSDRERGCSPGSCSLNSDSDTNMAPSHFHTHSGLKMAWASHPGQALAGACDLVQQIACL